jgi:predicted Zn-dependent protease
VNVHDGAVALLERLRGDGHPLVEVFVKRGRTRRSELGPGGPVSVLTDEEGWAVRAGGSAGSFFCCGSGAPPLDAEWPRPSGEALRLPDPEPVDDWEPGPDQAEPLTVEGEARGLVDSLSRELERRLQGAKLLRAVLDDGASEAHLVNSRGVDCTFGSRLATLRVEAACNGRPDTRTAVEVASCGAQSLRPRAVLGRLVDVLAVRAAGGRAPARERGEMVLGPAVGSRLLAALTPLWLGSEASERAATLSDRHNQLGSSALSIVDDGRLAGGALESPLDGEGVPTRSFGLVERGRYLQPLVDWREAESRTWRASGCTRRSGWRDRPHAGISHLYVVPTPEVAPAELISAVARGFYWLDIVGPATVDLAADRFIVEVCGFEVARGAAQHSIARAWLCGGVSALMRGVRATARDLVFTPGGGGLVGTPTLLVAGLEVRREP